MILDTSALVALFLEEPDSELLLEAILDAPAPKLSAASLVELNAVLLNRLRPENHRRAQQVLQSLDVELIAFDSQQARFASEAYRDFGKGSGHPAQLNLGDCFSYALAVSSGEPLLYVGNDFSHTDILPAVEP